MGRKAKNQGYESPLEKHPKHVKAIGMISIENASLESMLGELLGALLGIHLEIGHTLFFTPKAAIARLELLENVVEMSIGNDTVLVTKVNAVIKRTKAAIGKRHDVIHALWAGDEDGPKGEITRLNFPKGVGKVVPLSDLTDLIQTYRKLIEEVGPLIDEVQASRGFVWRPPVRWRP